MPQIFIAKDDYATKKILEATSECYLIGVLAHDDENYPLIQVMDQQRFINSFTIKPLCEEPDVLMNNSDSELFIGIDFHQSNSILPDDYNRNIPNNDRLDMLQDLLENKLIIFRPRITYSRVNSENIHKNLVIVDVLDIEVTDTTRYQMIPCITMDVQSFESKLKDLAYFSLNNFNSNVLNSPTFILCGDTLYFNQKDWVRHDNQGKLWRCDDFDMISTYKINSNLLENEGKLIRATDNLCFIENDALIAIQVGDYKAEIKVEPQQVEYEAEDEQIEEGVVNHIHERDFLSAFDLYTKSQGLKYHKDDLINLHVCIKTNTLTIIAGMSGTGKTQLAISYAQMLDLSEENRNLLFLPISPSYTEPEDVLGYYSNLSNKYVPAATGLVDLLVQAQNNVNKMHMVIFDEMNLSQIEHWFSPFISILERNPQDRFIQLYSANENCVNNQNYPSRVKINENVIFIGTVNLDETTKDISDRMLDRSFIVSLKKQDFALFNKPNDDIESDINKRIEVNKCRSTAEYNMWRVPTDSVSMNDFTDQELSFFEEAHQAISCFDRQKGISFRILRNIQQYLVNVPRVDSNNLYFRREHSIDLLFKQTVLSKIKGTENQLSELLGTYDRSKNVFHVGKLQEVMNRYSSVSEFEESRVEIEKKLRDMSYYGYTR